jgi:hypothetical protein
MELYFIGCTEVLCTYYETSVVGSFTLLKSRVVCMCYKSQLKSRVVCVCYKSQLKSSRLRVCQGILDRSQVTSNLIIRWCYRLSSPSNTLRYLLRIERRSYMVLPIQMEGTVGGMRDKSFMWCFTLK